MNFKFCERYASDQRPLSFQIQLTTYIVGSPYALLLCIQLGAVLVLMMTKVFNY